MIQMIDNTARSTVHDSITSQISLEAQEYLSDIADKICNDPDNCEKHLSEFLREYINEDSIIYKSFYRDMCESIKITKCYYENTTKLDKDEFKQYMHRMLLGCWLAINKCNFT